MKQYSQPTEDPNTSRQCRLPSNDLTFTGDKVPARRESSGSESAYEGYDGSKDKSTDGLSFSEINEDRERCEDECWGGVGCLEEERGYSEDCMREVNIFEGEYAFKCCDYTWDAEIAEWMKVHLAQH
jgi:hypothetical protein